MIPKTGWQVLTLDGGDSGTTQIGKKISECPLQGWKVGDSVAAA
jgi:hypothetical protein